VRGEKYWQKKIDEANDQVNKAQSEIQNIENEKNRLHELSKQADAELSRLNQKSQNRVDRAKAKYEKKKQAFAEKYGYSPEPETTGGGEEMVATPSKTKHKVLVRTPNFDWWVKLENNQLGWTVDEDEAASLDPDTAKKISDSIDHRFNPAIEPPLSPEFETPKPTESKDSDDMPGRVKFRKPRAHAPARNKPQDSGGSSGNKPQPKKGGGFDASVPILAILAVAVFLAIICVCYLNAQPFIQFVGMVAKSATGNLDEALRKLPVLGPMLLAIGGGFVGVTGSIFYLVCQLLELMPFFLTHSEKRVLKILNTISGRKKFEVKDDDDHHVKWLKHRHNNRPINAVAFFRVVKGVVYLVEFTICMITHPPCEGGLFKLFGLLASGGFSKINWGNIGLTLSVLFLVEFLVRLGFHIVHLLHTDSQIRKEEAEKEKEANAPA
jgi:hypothetical protein